VGQFEQGAEKFAKDGENASTAVVTACHHSKSLLQHLALNSGSYCRGDIRDDEPPVSEEVASCTAGGLLQP
jgi:hypothetical protein